MASYLQTENLSKSYGEKILFEHISFNINEGDKIALIAPNGAGKSTLLRILAGKDKSDSGGKITFMRHIEIAFLEQEYSFDPKADILGQILAANKERMDKMEEGARFEYELRVKKFVTALGLSPDQSMANLSGGEIKRVALADMLAKDADFYIMDEPTNHLDIEAIEYLENYLSHSKCTLLMVTHDRYFLDHVCNTVMELDHGALYIYHGGYEDFIEKRQARIDSYNAETAKVNNILRRELEWIHASPCARTGKAKYRINAFHDLKERSEQVHRDESIDMSALDNGSRLGNKIINCKDVSFRYGNDIYLKDFTYNFRRFERVGIVGKNGTGKSTFLNLLTGNIPEDGTMTGTIEIGASLKIGYYRQSGLKFNEDQTVLETVGDTKLLNLFLFNREMFNVKVAKLSGGERRRLYLLGILMQNPNLLILDEPTNDLDIVTLNILEEYLKDFKGSLIIVSHDRHFLDRLVEHLFIFCGDGIVKDFIGSYSEYHEYIKEYEKEQKRAAAQTRGKATSSSSESSQQQTAGGQRGESSQRSGGERQQRSEGDAFQRPERKPKLTWKEQKEVESLEADMDSLGKEKAGIEQQLSSGSLPYDKIEEMSRRFSEVTALLNEKEMRWLELQEKL